MSTLEESYRRILRFLPRAYRADRSEEMLTALLDAAGPEQRRPGVSEVLSLGTLAVRLRFGAPGASARGRLTGDIVRRAIVLSLMVQTVLSASSLAFFSSYEHLVPGIETLGYKLVQITLILALVFGWRRVGRVLSVVTLASIGLQVYSAFAFLSFLYDPVSTFFGIVFGAITVSAVFPAFHRDAPRLGGRGWWIGLWAAPMALIVFLSAELSYQAGVANRVWPVVYTLAGIAAVAVAVKQAKVSPAWPAALALCGWPLLLSAAQGGTFFSFTPSATALVVLAVAVEVVLSAAVLASLAFACRRRLTLA